MSMPPMPSGDPWPAIRLLLKAEATIRKGNPFDSNELTKLDNYWSDFVRLLLVYRHSKYNDITNIEEICAGFSSSTYSPFIEKKIGN
jgi:thymidylate synthase